MISVSRLIKHYSEQKAVNGISFSADRGEIVGFLGPNGAGKSTTMKMITGYLQPDSGHALVGGMDVSRDPLSVKKKIGYLPEANPLYTDMYVREYLGFLAGIHGIADKKTAIERAIKLTGLTPESKKKIGQLSKGYKQRVGLAGALIHDPEVLVLDEPTSGLDPNQIVEIRNVIREQGKDKTVLFSSHILQEVEAICNRVVIIDHGNIVADDTLEGLKKGSRDHHMVSVQFYELVEKNLLLSHIRGIERIEQPSPGNWQLQTTDPETVRRQLLQLAIDHNLNIVSLHSEKHNLEDIFRELTKQ
jgi:ABC-2 type transport system ATP-binding protein